MLRIYSYVKCITISNLRIANSPRLRNIETHTLVRHDEALLVEYKTLRLVEFYDTILQDGRTRGLTAAAGYWLLQTFGLVFVADLGESEQQYK